MKGVFQSNEGKFLFLQQAKMETIDAQVIRSTFLWSNCQVAVCPSKGASREIVLREMWLIGKNRMNLWVDSLSILLKDA